MKVYKYGAKVDADTHKRLTDILFLANKYRNRLVEIERERRAAVEAALCEMCPPLEQVTERMESISEQAESLGREIAAAKSAGRTGKVDLAKRAALRDLRTLLRDAKARVKELRKDLFSSVEWKEIQAKIDAKTLAAQKQARAECGIYWGTYLTVEDAAKDFRKGAPPRFMRYKGEGRVAVQFQGGLSPAALLAGDDKRMQIDRPTYNARAPWQQARIRIGSEGRAPLWAEFRTKLHRPLPSEGQIKWAWLYARRIGTQTKWTLQLVVDGDEHAEHADSGEVAIDIGWRQVPEGMRAATWIGDDGETGHLYIPPDRIAQYDRVETLQSERDESFNAARAALTAWIRQADEIPEWLEDRTPHLAQWRSAARLAALVIHWRGERFDGDSDIYSEIERWRETDKKLYDRQSFIRRNFQEWRKNLYLNFAADMARDYRTVILRDVKYRDFDETDIADDEDPMRAATVNNRRMVSPYMLTDTITKRFAAGVAVKAEYTTQTCHACGHVCNFDAATNIHNACQQCGATWDQDRNACRNMLSSGEVVAE